MRDWTPEERSPGWFDDVPRNGAFVLAAAPARTCAIAVQAALGVTEQAASQLIDTLVLRGYLARHPHPGDRRRTELAPTERGRGAAQAVQRGVARVDHELSGHLTGAESAALRSSGVHPSRIVPVFAVADTGRAVEHHASLGFDAEPATS